MRVALTGVANAQVVTLHVSGVNGGSGSSNVPFGFLIADANSSRQVDKPDFSEIKGQIGQPVTASNFRDDVVPDGTIGRDDALEVKTHRAETLP